MLIISTSAEIDLLNEMRTFEYLKTIQWLKKNVKDHNIVWLESITNNISYVENSFPVYYSNCHNPNYTNKGANLGQSLKKFFQICDVKDDLIVQLTGRYHFLDNYFFDTIENNPGYDLYAKNDGYDQYFTGCFAMTKKYFIDWVNSTDWDLLNYNMINIEKSLWNYAKTKNINCYDIDSVHMRCNIFGQGDCEIVYL